MELELTFYFILKFKLKCTDSVLVMKTNDKTDSSGSLFTSGFCLNITDSIEVDNKYTEMLNSQNASFSLFIE